MYRLSPKFTIPWVRLYIKPFTTIHTCAHISPSTQKLFQRASYYKDCYVLSASNFNSILVNNYSSKKNSAESINISPSKDDSDVSAVPSAKVSARTKLKHAVRDYGATIIVFHVTISLASLGLFYLAISNGVDAVRLLTFIGFSESVISSKLAVGGSTFVIAYAVHKLFAPVRIACTLSVAPFIVRYLRRMNWLKSPVKKDN